MKEPMSRDPSGPHRRAGNRFIGNHRQPSRRQVLSGLAGLAGSAAALGATGCASPPPPPPGTGDSGASASAALVPDRSASERIVRWSNWTDYLDRSEDNRSYPTLAAFEERTGIDVTYVEDIDDNDVYLNKIGPQLRAGQDVGRDLIVLSDWMVNRLIRDRLVAPLDHAAMPHRGNVLDALHSVTYDRERQFSLPWQSGFAGIAYHRGRLGRDLKSVADLWADDLKGRVTLLTEMRDTAGLIMLAQGTDVARPFSRGDIERAFEEVRRRIADGYVRRIRGNSYLEDFKAGNAVAGFAWSGDIFSLRNELGTDDWQFVLPDSGGILWSDTAVIPATSTHRANAMTLLDYYYEPEVAARVAAWVCYICPVKGAQQAMERIDPTLAANPFLFPTADYLTQHAHEFRALTAQEDAEYGAAWAKVIGN